MFTRFISLVLVAPLVSALTVNPPTGVISGGTINFSWVTAAGDPSEIQLELFNSAFNYPILIAYNVDLSLGNLTRQCPIVPSGDNYVIQASNLSAFDTTQVLAQSATFSIGAINSSSGSATNTSTLTSSSSTASTTPSSNSSPSSSTTIHRDAIIGGVIGGLVLISLLLVLFFNHRRKNWRSQALSDIDPFPDVVNSFTVPSWNPTTTFLPENYTSNGQSLPSQSISSKFTQRGQPSDPASTSSGGGLPPLTPLRPQFSSPAVISTSSSRLPLTELQTNLDGTTNVPQAATEPSMQRSPSPPEANARYLRHEDSGVRIPPAENDLVELPPFYTPG